MPPRTSAAGARPQPTALSRFSSNGSPRAVRPMTSTWSNPLARLCCGIPTAAGVRTAQLWDTLNQLQRRIAELDGDDTNCPFVCDTSGWPSAVADDRVNQERDLRSWGKLSRSGGMGDQGDRPCGTNDGSGEATDIAGSPDTATPSPPRRTLPGASTSGRAELHVTQQLRYRTVTPGGQNWRCSSDQRTTFDPWPDPTAPTEGHPAETPPPRRTGSPTRATGRRTRSDAVFAAANGPPGQRPLPLPAGPPRPPATPTVLWLRSTHGAHHRPHWT
jgi:hypothetical protein